MGGIIATVRNSSFETPDIMEPGQPGTTNRECLAPPSNEEIDKMIFLGREHAKTWAVNKLEQQYALTARLSLRLSGTGTNSKDRLAPSERSVDIPTKDIVAARQRSQAQAVRAELPQGWRSLRKWPLTSRTHPIRISRFAAHTALHAVCIPAALLIGLLTCIGVTFVVLRNRRDVASNNEGRSRRFLES